MSIRARLLGHTMRWFIVGADKSLEEMRSGLEKFGRLSRRDVADCSDVTVGGVPALRVTPRSEPSGRHVLYLHGGAYNIR